VPDDSLQATIRAELERERAQMHAQLGELVPGRDTSLTFDENFADSAQVAAEVGENQALAANLRDQLVEVEAAVERIDAGTYGTCETCGGPIGADRLDAMPSARFCISHA